MGKAYYDKLNKCLEFFYELADILEGRYELVESCNLDVSSYLVPNGTADDISYYGKPEKSFRVSDHWNWYANLSKCSRRGYVQCYSVDVPRARRRLEEGKASKPRVALQVCRLGDDGKYHAIYGEKFDYYLGEYVWVENTPEAVVEQLCA